MFFSHKYLWFAYNLILLLIWLGLFLWKKETRKEMLTMSILIMPFVPIAEFFFIRDYWKPELFNGWSVGIEELIFGFAFGGVTAILYEEIFEKKHSKRHLPRHT